MKKTYLLFIALCSVICSLCAEERLIFAIDVVRHGDRTALVASEKLPHAWKEGLGQLTGKGMNQHFALGTKLRKKYVDEKGLLPAEYQTDTIYVRSTDYDRTLMSAQSLLLGLYPPGTGQLHPVTKLQPIPIHTKSTDNDELVSFHFNEPPLSTLIEKHVFTREDWKKRSEALSPQFKKWTEAIGHKVENLRNLIMAGDLLHVHSLHQAPLPTTLSKKEINEIIGHGNWVMTTIFSTPEVSDMLGQKMLMVVSDYLKQASEKKSSLKYVLVSGHDTTILAILAALGAPLDTIPPYASHLSFELYEKDNKEQFVKVIYNDKPHSIPACGGNECKLETLLLAPPPSLGVTGCGCPLSNRSS